MKIINESSWDSSDYLHDIKIGGYVFRAKYICVYDTYPGYIGYSVVIEPTPEEMLEIGIWSKSFFDDPTNICIFDDGFDVINDSIRDYDDFDIINIFDDNLMEKTNKLNMSKEQFVEIVKNTEQFTDIQYDIILLGDIDGISFKRIWDPLKKRIGIISDSFEKIDEIIKKLR